jgi:Na+/citrate or Na+/malate symporter
MERCRKLFGVVLRGALLGAVLAMAVPEKTVSAGTCVCNDTGSGSWACNAAQTACDSGSEGCEVKCG